MSASQYDDVNLSSISAPISQVTDVNGKTITVGAQMDEARMAQLKRFLGDDEGELHKQFPNISADATAVD